jgi:multiple sugar transport system permease protein
MEKKQSFWSKYGNDYFFLAPWLLCFVVFIVIPIAASLVLSFTNFDMVQTPDFVGIDNYLRLFLNDDIFVTSLMNTLLFAMISGPVGYILSFVYGWLINDLGRAARTVLTFLFYTPSLVGGSYLIWTYLFSNDAYGILNSFLLSNGFIDTPIQWLTDPDFNFCVVVVVMLWGGMGTGFLSFVAGFQGLNKAYFEAAAIDGIRNRWQELWYITLPQMGPQLLIGAVLSISGAFSVGAVPAALTGNPSTDYSTHTLLLHIQDYSGARLELGYASAVAVILFAIMIIAWVGLRKLLSGIAGD